MAAASGLAVNIDAYRWLCRYGGKPLGVVAFDEDACGAPCCMLLPWCRLEQGFASNVSEATPIDSGHEDLLPLKFPREFYEQLKTKLNKNKTKHPLAWLDASAVIYSHVCTAFRRPSIFRTVLINSANFRPPTGTTRLGIGAPDSSASGWRGTASDSQGLFEPKDISRFIWKFNYIPCFNQFNRYSLHCNSITLNFHVSFYQAKL